MPLGLINNQKLPNGLPAGTSLGGVWWGLMPLDSNLLARIAKVVAILGFFLPWATVSCSNMEMATGTGFQLIMGDLQPSAQLQQFGEGQSSTSDNTSEQTPNYFTLAALVAIVVGLFGSMFVSRRLAAGVLLVCSLLSAGLSVYSLQVMRDRIGAALAEHQSTESASANPDGPYAELGNNVAAAKAASIQIEEEVGFFVTLGALLAAGGLGAIGVAVREKSTTPSSDSATL